MERVEFQDSGRDKIFFKFGKEQSDMTKLIDTCR